MELVLSFPLFVGSGELGSVHQAWAESSGQAKSLFF